MPKRAFIYLLGLFIVYCCDWAFRPVVAGVSIATMIVAHCFYCCDWCITTKESTI